MMESDLLNPEYERAGVNQPRRKRPDNGALVLISARTYRIPVRFSYRDRTIVS